MIKQINILGIPFLYKNTPDQTIIQVGGLPLFSRVKTENACLKAESAQKKKAVLPIKRLSNKEIRIAIQFKGGFGDQLICCNYTKALRYKLKDNSLLIDVYCRDFIGELFLQEEKFVNSFSKEQNFDPEDGRYDLYIRLDRFPVILKSNDKIIQKNALLFKYVLLCRNFKENNKQFFTGRSEFDSILNIYTLIKGQKRCNQIDIDGFLGMDDQFKYEPQLPQSSVLEKYGLKNKKYITLHRGVDSSRTKDSNKLWPISYYNELISLIKKRFPDIILVQIGVNTDRCPPMEKIDVNLVGKTTMTDVAHILKNSALHIDGEGGMVHIRHAVSGGKSVVFFGPTSIDFYGYSENINLCAHACPHWCEHIKEKWDEGCIISGREPLCMAKILPSDVFKKITNYLKDEN